MPDPTIPDHAAPRPPPEGLPVRYTLGDLLGEGGQSVVFAAHDGRLDREVALKILFATSLKAEQAMNEARLTSQLQHRGIVAVFDQGRLRDGRLWFAMRKLRGQALSDWASARGGADGAIDPEHLPDLVEVIEQVCHTVGYAHGQGVVHCDLKPDNVMVEARDSIQVLDWGIAGAAEGEPQPSMQGTPHFMAPERARPGYPRQPTADVYAVGATLYQLLSGRTPYRGTARQVLQQLRRDPPPPLSVVLPTVDRDLRDLTRIVERAMAPDPQARHADCRQLAEDLAEWQRVRKARRNADALVEEGAAIQLRLDAVRARQAALMRQADALLQGVQPHAPAHLKVDGWAAEDAAARCGQTARGLRMELERRLHTALNHDHQNPSAHRMLAALYRARSEEAEDARQHGLAKEFADRVAQHDHGEHRAWCAGMGRVSLTTRPAGARVVVHGLSTVRRRLTPAATGLDLGTTPLREIPIARGPWLARVTHPNGASLAYPLWIERAGHWEDRAPDGRVVAVDLGAVARTPADACFVPAGWFRSGGDPIAADPLPAAWRWTEAFYIQRFPVDHARYLTFINDLARTDLEAARQHCPRQSRAVGGQRLYQETDAGFALAGCAPDKPVTLIDWHSARAFARWHADQTGRPWRLVHALEWEKAARGVGGRCFPWGDTVEPSYANMVKAHAGAPGPTANETFPTDESVYGVRGMAGNVRDWCRDVYSRDAGVSPADTPTHGDFRNVRGGSFSSNESYCRLASRFAERPTRWMSAIGIRLSCPIDA